MARHAFILGGTGQIGRAIARELAASGWRVTATHRGRGPAPAEMKRPGVTLITVDRDAPDSLARALGEGADDVIDTVAFDVGHAQQWLALQDRVGAFVVISSASVYRDEAGRTLDEAAVGGFPVLPNPIPETHPTVDPGNATYSTRKVAMEREWLDRAAVPVTILRPCAIYGTGSRNPREWWFVKRMLDRRPIIPLAYDGASRFHTTATANIAAVARSAMDQPASRILNVGDTDPPSVREIGAAIAAHLSYPGQLAGIEGDAFPPAIGRTPWSVPHPFLLECRAARALDAKPLATYAESVGATCAGLVAEADRGDWRDRFPRLAAYPRDLFDYSAEDAFLAVTAIPPTAPPPPPCPPLGRNS